MILRDLRPDFRWLFSGFFMTFCSAFGQTFFIALFAGHIKAELGLSDGLFGGIYTAATLLSAAIIVWAGRLADRLAVRWLGAGVMIGLGVTTWVMASAESLWLLAPALLGLRFFGQGMLTHVAMTATARWFSARRGRAVSIAALGFPVSEALLPVSAVLLMGAVGWRGTWLLAGTFLLLVALPLLLLLVRHERRSGAPQPVADRPIADRPAAVGETNAGAGHGGAARPRRPEWTQARLLQSPLFYALLPVVLAPAFIQTGIFFNQVVLVDSKGWALSWFAVSYPVMAAVSVLTALGSGVLVDRIGARRLLPVFLLPLGLAITLLAAIPDPWILPLFMALAGLTNGAAATTLGALWAELFGTRHLGAIRATAMAGTVFASALSPGLLGLLLDMGIPFAAQLYVMGGYCLLASLWMLPWMTRLHRLAVIEIEPDAAAR